MNPRPSTEVHNSKRDTLSVDFSSSPGEELTPKELVAQAIDIYEWGQELSAQYKSLVALGHNPAPTNYATNNDVSREREIKGLPLQASLSHLQTQLDLANAQLAAFHNASTWRMTAPIRASVTLARKIATIVKQEAGKSTRFKPKTVTSQDQPTNTSVTEEFDQVNSTCTIHIVHTQHTQYVADLLTSSLRRYGLKTSASLEMPAKFNDDFYIVVCAQMFDRLPPSEKLICYQLEQSTSSRWLHGQYLDILRDSRAVLDYSLRNIRYLDALGISYPKMFYAPISSIAFYEEFLTTKGTRLEHSIEKTTDVLFYGDDKVGRRTEILDRLSKKFSIKIINNLFGTELLNEIRKAKVVLNLHYYGESLLESTRIYECLSLGTRIVSETVVDADEHTALAGLVSFARCGDIEDITEKLNGALLCSDPPDGIMVNELSVDFTFHIGRMLLALGVIDYKLFSERCSKFKFTTDRIALSLPETWKRRRFLNRCLDKDTFVFDGVRATPGWVGAAASYKFIAERLLEQGVERAMIYEDDADFTRFSPSQIHAFVEQIEAHFGEWDIISGFMGDLHPEAKIDRVININGEHCVSLDKMVSMVCNIYNKKALERISRWNENNLHVSNTIDRFLEEQNDLRIITASPFLVDHNESLDSSLWNVTNSAMRVMIDNSKRKLRDKIWHHQALKFLQRSK